MRLDDWLRETAGRLESVGFESARLEAQMLAGHVLRADRTWLLAHPEHEFPVLAGESLVQRRILHEPLAYILGWREFFGRRFIVGPGVLVPRQETEILIEVAFEMASRWPSARILDLGTGSGAIAATLKLERPGWTVAASDVSANALGIALENFYQLGADVLPVNADGCSAFTGSAFDMIVTNPPYVSHEDFLPKEVKDWEPAEALFAGDSGLDFYRRLSGEAIEIVGTDGFLVTELGIGQIEVVRQIFEAQGWRFSNAWKDLAGIERVLAMQRGQ